MSKRPNTLKKLLYGRANWCPNVQSSNFLLFWTIGRWTLTSITKKVMVIDYSDCRFFSCTYFMLKENQEKLTLKDKIK